jgi:hypothetical protein
MKRRSLKTKFDSKTIMDVGLAGLAVRVLPNLINKFVPLDPSLYAVAAAGGTYLVGSLLKKPVMANAGIALGVVELVAPYLENLLGGITGDQPMLKPVTGGALIKQPALPVTMADFISLNDGSYVPYPTSSRDYQSAY